MQSIIIKYNQDTKTNGQCDNNRKKEKEKTVAKGQKPVACLMCDQTRQCDGWHEKYPKTVLCLVLVALLARTRWHIVYRAAGAEANSLRTRGFCQIMLTFFPPACDHRVRRARIRARAYVTYQRVGSPSGENGKSHSTNATNA